VAAAVAAAVAAVRGLGVPEVAVVVPVADANVQVQLLVVDALVVGARLPFASVSLLLRLTPTYDLLLALDAAALHLEDLAVAAVIAAPAPLVVGAGLRLYLA